MEEGISLYDPQQHSAQAMLYGLDLGVQSLSVASGPLWFLGYPDQALTKSNEAISLARALGFVTTLHLLRWEGAVAQEHCDAVIALCREQEFMSLLPHIIANRGQALIQQGHTEEEIPLLPEGYGTVQATGGGLYRRSYIGLRGNCYFRRQWAESRVRSPKRSRRMFS